MTDFIVEAITGADVGKYLATLIISMIPVIELRGAIPIGVSLGLSHAEAMGISIIGNMLPVPFIILFIRPIFRWMTRKSGKLARLAEKLETKAEGKWDKIHRYQFFALTIFVAIPLPGTGAWSGALIAAVMNMRLRNALPSILLGVLIAGILVSGITYGFTSIFN
ncbi:MAG: COG2426 family protein [Oscillospiraceae bacterium]